MKNLFESWRAFKKQVVMEHDTGIRAAKAPLFWEFFRSLDPSVPTAFNPEESPYYDRALRTVAKMRVEVQREFISGRRKEALMRNITDEYKENLSDPEYLATDIGKYMLKIKREFEQLPVEEQAKEMRQINVNSVDEIFPKIAFDLFHERVHDAIATVPVRWSNSANSHEVGSAWGTWTHTPGSVGEKGVVTMNGMFFLNPKFDHLFENDEERFEMMEFTLHHEINHMIDFWGQLGVGLDWDPSKPLGHLLSTRQKDLIQTLYKYILGVTQKDINIKTKFTTLDRSPEDSPVYSARAYEVWPEILQLYRRFPGGLAYEDLKMFCEWRTIKNAFASWGRGDDDERAGLDIERMMSLQRQLDKRGLTNALRTQNTFLSGMDCKNLTREAIDEFNKKIAAAGETEKQNMRRKMTAEE